MDVKIILKIYLQQKGTIPSDFSVSTISSFKSIEKRHDVYRCKDCIKKFCESLRHHTMKIINLENKKNKVINKTPARII